MTAAAARSSTVLPLPGRPLFVFTVFLGSFLLFLVQPMFARVALPSLGGAPGVWSVALVFYQGALLAGYIYAHILTKRGGRVQPLIHLGLFAAAAVTLPIALRSIGGYEAIGPTIWLLLTLTVSIGPVFFVVSSQAPLLQRWYAMGAKTAGRDPYFLYAASNAGSLLALAAYPLVVEPYLGVETQRVAWSAGFVLLALLTGLAGRGLRLEPALEEEKAEPVTFKQYAYWTALAAVPSGLMLSTTSYLTMDIVSVPLLWVIPLGLYLLSFVIAFSEGGAVFVRQARFISPLLLLAIGSFAFQAEGLFAFLFAMAGLILLFYVALALHGELARTRPAPASLTNFYISMSVGGVIGGLFPALVAPAIFDWVWEHPILLVGAAALIPATPLFVFLARAFDSERGQWLAGGLVVLSFALALLTLVVPEAAAETLPYAIIGVALLLIGQRVAFALAFTALLLSMGGFETAASRDELRARSFFGTYTVAEDREKGTRQLMHGTTLHGVQRTEEERSGPLGYYGPESGPALVLRAAAPNASVGVVGLGVGALACYAKAGQNWTFYEIDPVVVEIATDDRLFTYLSECTPDADIVVGDARVQLRADEGAAFDYLVVDAFSSDAIPQHLMTLEAFDLYRRRMAADGMLLIHISNRYLDLAPVVAAIAKEMGWQARIRDHRPDEDNLFARSIYVALSADEARIEALDASGEWERLPSRQVEPWRDDFGSIVSVLRY